MKRALAALALLVGCAGRAPAPATPPPAASAPVPQAAPAPATAPPATPLPATPERLAAVSRCQQAFAHLADSKTAGIDLVHDCADLYREPACAQAMRDVPADFAGYPDTVARACRDAYCPHLPAPRPKLCDNTELPPHGDLFDAWGDLHHVIFALELGVDPKALPPIFKPLSTAMPVLPGTAPTPAVPTPTVHVYAKPEGRDRARVWLDGEKPILVNVDGSTAPLGALAREARSKLPQATDARLVFSIDKRVPHGVVLSLIDAFKKEGFHKFAISVTPAPAN